MTFDQAPTEATRRRRQHLALYKVHAMTGGATEHVALFI